MGWSGSEEEGNGGVGGNERGRKGWGREEGWREDKERRGMKKGRG